MDAKLVGWARAVKSRRRWTPGALPPLWLFTDPIRGGAVLAAVDALPKGLCGVVFRHDGIEGRAELAHLVWRICRNRRLVMVAAGAPLRFAGPGLHLRGGCLEAAGGRARTGWGLRTASAHNVAQLIQGARNNAAAIFLSPVFRTASHPGAAGFGVVRWARLARYNTAGAFGAVYALGGIDGVSVRRLPRWACGAGAIGALLP